MVPSARVGVPFPAGWVGGGQGASRACSPAASLPRGEQSACSVPASAAPCGRCLGHLFPTCRLPPLSRVCGASCVRGVAAGATAGRWPARRFLTSPLLPLECVAWPQAQQQGGGGQRPVAAPPHAAQRAAGHGARRALLLRPRQGAGEWAFASVRPRRHGRLPLDGLRSPPHPPSRLSLQDAAGASRDVHYFPVAAALSQHCAQARKANDAWRSHQAATDVLVGQALLPDETAGERRHRLSEWRTFGARGKAGG